MKMRTDGTQEVDLDRRIVAKALLLTPALLGIGTGFGFLLRDDWPKEYGLLQAQKAFSKLEDIKMHDEESPGKRYDSIDIVLEKEEKHMIDGQLWDKIETYRITYKSTLGFSDGTTLEAERTRYVNPGHLENKYVSEVLTMLKQYRKGDAGNRHEEFFKEAVGEDYKELADSTPAVEKRFREASDEEKKELLEYALNNGKIFGMGADDSDVLRVYAPGKTIVSRGCYQLTLSPKVTGRTVKTQHDNTQLSVCEAYSKNDVIIEKKSIVREARPLFEAGINNLYGMGRE